jgi:hypothetical protein
MPSSAGPNTLGEENLVFGYDLGDVSNSYKGEPTANLIPAPERNARFTTDNSWYTYNTAQYNGNTYFSIGAVASVSNNEVTLSSVGRTLYTYDVLRPQTTGGGVTAGTNYMVKKTGTNKFTLHEYNGNESGSQGYRDPATGAFKVHESVALDQRISINTTDFPTMWWGPPHVPNMCFVKEVVSSGGPNENSSFMRIHLTRPAGTDGGMAYGVYPQVTQGDLITVSFWARSSVNSNWSWSTYFAAGYSAPGFSISSTTEWQRFQYTWTASNTFGFYMYFYPGNPGFVSYYVDLADIQVEVNKGHATPFTLSSRSATQGLIDLTGNSTIDLTNVSFDSDAQMTFDGTDDYIEIGGYFNYDNATLSMWIRPDSLSNITIPISKNTLSSPHLYGYIQYYDNQLRFYAPGNNLTVNWGTISTNTWYNIVLTVNGSLHVAYKNGVQISSQASNLPLFTGDYNVQLGRYGTGNPYRYQGLINSLRIYNRALTAQEVASNYNAIKGRFNI